MKHVQDMGAMTDIQKTYTFADIVRESGRTKEAVQKMYKRTWPDRQFSLSGQVQADELDVLNQKYRFLSTKQTEQPQRIIVTRAKKPVEPEQVEPEKVEPEKVEPVPQTSSQPTLLDVINYSDMALIVSGCWIMLGWIGLIVSGMAVAFFWDTLQTVKRQEAWDSRTLGLVITTFIVVISGGLHFITFRTILRDTDSDLPMSIDTTAIVLAVFVSVISLSSLFQSSNKTTDKL